MLLIRRNARADDDHYGKVNGLGGKVEIDEDILTSARRELHEEAGITDRATVLIDKDGKVLWSEAVGPGGARQPHDLYTKAAEL